MTPTVTGAANGLSVLSGNVVLGGNPLDLATTLDQGGFDMIIHSVDVNGSITFSLLPNGKEISFENLNSIFGVKNGIQSLAESLIMYFKDVATNEVRQFTIDATGIIVTDSIGTTGMKYEGNYNVNQLLDDRNITDVGGVKALIAASGGVTASNGLTAVGTDVRDGGTLTQNTLKTCGEFEWNLSAYKDDFSAFCEFQYGAGQGYFIASAGLNRNAEMFVQGNVVNTARAYIGVTKRISAVNKHKAIDITYEDTGVGVKDEVDLLGLVYRGDYTANQIVDDRAITDVGGVRQVIGFAKTAVGEVTAQTVNANIVTVAVAVDRVFRVNVYGINTAFTAGSYDIVLNYTDINGTVTANTLATVVASNASDIAPAIVKAKAGTSLTIDTVVTGTLTYTAGAIVEALN